MTGAGDIAQLLSGSVAAARPRNVFRIRTSDRITYRRCRRKWNWSFSHRGNRQSGGTRSPLWVGTGFHFALEDIHGRRLWKSGSHAFIAYANACRRAKLIPENVLEDIELATGMLDYYEMWLTQRPALRTHVVDDMWQTERYFEIDITHLIRDHIAKQAADSGRWASAGNVEQWSYLNNWDQILYCGTFDRVITDAFGRLWLVEYKTARAFDTGKFDVDAQVSSYCWAGLQVYNQPFAGVIYQQHKKLVPDAPQFLKSTGTYSVNKQQATTHPLYREALLKLYGTPERFPAANVQFLNYLAEQEGEESDRYIRRDYVPRNQHQIAAEQQKIVFEAIDMMNPNQPLYPNPTKDCSWDCDFHAACINMDDGSDHEFEIEHGTINRSDEDLSWKQFLDVPPQPLGTPLDPKQSSHLTQASPLGLLPRSQ